MSQPPSPVLLRAGRVTVQHHVPGLGDILHVEHCRLPGFDLRLVGTGGTEVYAHTDLVPVLPATPRAA